MRQVSCIGLVCLRISYKVCFMLKRRACLCLVQRRPTCRPWCAPAPRQSRHLWGCKLEALRLLMLLVK
jgi:hypothetical protein